jgi:hypothetical protein
MWKRQLAAQMNETSQGIFLMVEKQQPKAESLPTLKEAFGSY